MNVHVFYSNCDNQLRNQSCSGFFLLSLVSQIWIQIENGRLAAILFFRNHVFNQYTCACIHLPTTQHVFWSEENGTPAESLSFQSDNIKKIIDFIKWDIYIWYFLSIQEILSLLHQNIPIWKKAQSQIYLYLVIFTEFLLLVRCSVRDV